MATEPKKYSTRLARHCCFAVCGYIFVCGLQDDRVLYMSLHRHDEGMFYPMGEPKDYADVGEGRGRGYSVNIPWNHSKVGDEAYGAAFAKVRS